jgi:pimeloyl-ACP methyl ester carboxylesterase
VPVAEVSERRTDVLGLETFWRRAEPDCGAATVLYVHGVPTSSDDWMPFLERTGGVALDLPGFGRSAKPADFDYSIAGYDRFLEEFLEAAGLDRFSLVVHDWGAVALATAQRLPERLERLVMFSPVPFLPGFEWHRLAKLWRTPAAGEVAMGLTTRFVAKQLSREVNAAPGPMPDDFVDSVYGHFDHGTQRAILKLYRSADLPVLAAAGRGLERIDSPSLLLFGERDPYVPARFGDAYAEALGGGPELRVLENTGHWSWLDRPELVDEVADFLCG